MFKTGKPNLVLTGFMGTGKSTVGALVAQRLGREFVDTDRRLEDKLRLSISAVFAQQGEGYFRKLEAELVASLCQQRGLVVATGGGTFLDDSSRKLLLSTSCVVALKASEEAICARLDGAIDRPLLPSQSTRSFMLASRQNVYDAAPIQVSTDGLSVEEVADRVVEAMNRDGAFSQSAGADLPVVSPAAGYPIRVVLGGLNQMGRCLKQREIPEGPVVVVSDGHVLELHGQSFLKGLRAEGYQPLVLMVPRGESAKTLDEVSGLYAQLADARVERFRPVLAFGGGSIGDVAGYLAATWLRGVPLFQIPTTLLSMVDSSVGGKTGVGLKAGKNLVGAFKHPELVLQDPDLLNTLSDREFAWGLAESVKHGLIASPTLFQRLETTQDPRADILEILRESIQVKIDIVAKDPWEKGRREVLNLGHTFAHALEKVSDYRLSHGEAVAIGLVAAAELSLSLGRCEAGLPGKIRGVLEKLKLPTSAPGLSVEAVLQGMNNDKKRRQGVVRFVIPFRVGHVGITSASQEILGAVLRPLLQA